jgi:hypothetical protein
MDQLQTFMTEISNALFGTIEDMYQKDLKINQEQDVVVYTLMKENRFMYLTLLFIFVLVMGNWMFAE